MTELTPPVPPMEQPKKDANGMKLIGIIMVLLAAVALLVGILVASGDESSAPAATNPPGPAQTYAPTPVVNKYEAYLNHVYNNSGQANTIDKADLISYGDTICSALNKGQSIPYIVSYLSDRSAGETDAALFASVIFGAITYICDEYKGDLNLYLSTSN
jgi:hypothetical protein